MKIICILLFLLLTACDDTIDINNPVTSPTGCVSGLKPVAAVKITDSVIELTLRNSVNGPASIKVSLLVFNVTAWTTFVEANNSDSFNTLIIQRSNLGNLGRDLASNLARDYYVTVTCK